jgi:hypothetical protein
MPSPPPETLPLRIIIEQPLPGVALALQHGKDGLEMPTAASPTRVVFDFSVRIGTRQADGTPNFLGPFAQGPAAGRFAYICVGRRAGQKARPCDGRMKVPLTGISQAQVMDVAGDSGKRLAVHVPGRNPKGGPTVATVKLPEDAWTVVADS